jgi:plastocyanin
MRKPIQQVVRAAGVLALLIPVLASGAAGARAPTPQRAGGSQFDVIVRFYDYGPDKLMISPGDAVTWVNEIGRHSATSNTPVNLWDSGILAAGVSWSHRFKTAGTYLYHCTLHFDMTAYVSVVPTVTPKSGQVGTIFTITLSSEDAPPSLVYDVQMKAPGSNWRPWMTGVTTMSVEFDSTDRATGVYEFRARMRRLSDNVTPLWSFPIPLRVEPLGG